MWEHTQWVCKITKKSEIEKASKYGRKTNLQKSKHSHKVLNKAGRTPTVRGDFSSRKHPNFKTHTNRMCEIPFVPILLGDALPCGDRGIWEREQWCRAMVILFKPWRKSSDLKLEHGT
jgi:hypothetical protein